MNRTRGTLVRWFEDKHFGFIRPDDGGQDVFVHARDFGKVSRPPVVGDVIRYQPANDGGGRFRAADVTIEGVARTASLRPARREPRTASQRSPKSAFSSHAGIVCAAVFACVVVGLAMGGKLSPIVPFIYVVLSGCTFIAYAFDKSAAMNNRWRLRERTLHLLGVLGGWPGAAVAQQMFRHKSRKTAFQIGFWISALVNCGVLLCLATAEGRATIRALAG